MNRRRSDHRRGRAGRLPRNAPPVELTISHVGGRGDGVGRAAYKHNHVTEEHAVFVPATLPGEQVVAKPQAISGQGIRAMLHEIVTASPERRDPDCDAFPACGGCSFQHWQDDAVTSWKQEMVLGFLARADVPVPQVTPPHVAPRHSRRRAGFHLKRLTGGVAAGFLERGSDRIVAPAGCSVVDPALTALLNQLAELAATRFPVGVPVDAQANMLDNGICLLLRGPEGWHDRLLEDLAGWASDRGLSRLSVAEGDAEPLTLLAPAPPVLRFGGITVTPPPGAFLQATRESEAVLQHAVADILGDAARVIDLFAGCGTLSLPRLDRLSRLTAVESDAAALAAMKAAVDSAGRGAQLECIEADLMRAPLTADIFAGVDAVIIDPPRAGAAAQCEILAATSVPAIAMVSCSPPSFARDAASLVAGGYRMSSLQVIDQFRFSSHVELVAGFIRD
ncbi:MAG: RsmD family RNA methyltransferase [Pseudomonadota bacterium]|nr:RsmD family RNA methyltransferase [Pseudomonadota bacterium]